MTPLRSRHLLYDQPTRIRIPNNWGDMGWCGDTVFIIWTTTVVVGFQRASWNSHPTWWSPYRPRHPHSAQTWSIKGQTNFMCPACPQQKHTSAFRVTIWCTFSRWFFALQMYPLGMYLSPAHSLPTGSQPPKPPLSPLGVSMALAPLWEDRVAPVRFPWVAWWNGCGLVFPERHPLGTFEGLTKSPEIFTYIAWKRDESSEPKLH